MLVLARKTGEDLVIGENAEIVISVLSQHGGQVKLGIKAHHRIPVHRMEIYQRIKEEGNVLSGLSCDKNNKRL